MYLLVFLGVLLGWLAVIIGVHEAGHAAAAVALGFEDVRVGWFPPHTSYVGNTLWGRVIAVSLAGSAANVLLGVGCWAAAQSTAVDEAGLSSLLGVGAFFSILFGATNLVPVPGSDGWTVATALGHLVRR